MLDGLRNGRIDFVPFPARTPEREREFAFSKPYFEMPYLLVSRVDAPLYWDLGSLRGKHLALALAAKHPLRPLSAQRFPRIQVVDAVTGNDAMDKVASGDADAAVVGACMHKLAMLIYGVLRSGQPFDVNFEKKKLAFQDGI